QFETATFVRETIDVKGRADPVIVDVAITRHGPIGTPALKGQTAALALRWTALDPGRLVDFVFGLARAGSWQEFRAAAADFSGAAGTLERGHTRAKTEGRSAATRAGTGPRLGRHDLGRVGQRRRHRGVAHADARAYVPGQARREAVCGLHRARAGRVRALRAS